MKCKDVRAAISARFDGGDMGANPAALEAHLAVCRRCRAEAEAVGLTGELLGAVRVPEPSASFDERVFAGLNRRGWFDQLCEWFEIPVRRVAVMLAFSTLVVASVLLLPQSAGHYESELSILERQAAQIGLDISDIAPVDSAPAERSQGGTIKCA